MWNIKICIEKYTRKAHEPKTMLVPHSLLFVYVHMWRFYIVFILTWMSSFVTWHNKCNFFSPFLTFLLKLGLSYWYHWANRRVLLLIYLINNTTKKMFASSKLHCNFLFKNIKIRKMTDVGRFLNIASVLTSYIPVSPAKEIRWEQ